MDRRSGPNEFHDLLESLCLLAPELHYLSSRDKAQGLQRVLSAHRCPPSPRYLVAVLQAGVRMQP